MVLDVVEIKGGLPTRHLGQHDQGLDYHQTDLVGHAEEIWFSADGNPCGDMSHQFLGHVVGGQGIDDGTVLWENRRDQHQVVEPAGIIRHLGNFGKQVDIPLGIDGHHRIPLADILLDDVLHDSGLAHPGGAETPEMTLAVAIGETQLYDRLGMIEMYAGTDMGPRLLRPSLCPQLHGSALTIWTSTRSFSSRSTAMMTSRGSFLVTRTTLLWPT